MEKRPKIVIAGGGFGGLAAAKALADAPVEVTVVDRHNYHLFQPLLYQVATAALSPSEVAWPIRSILRGQANARVLMAEVTGVDMSRCEVLLGKDRQPYDYLIIASGAATSWFGHDEWAPFAPGLKDVDDAVALRRRILTAFERAEAATDPAALERLRTFVIVGGGPTGVELAGAVTELARESLHGEFRRIDTRQARVLLLEAAERLLSPFPASLGQYAKAVLEECGVDVHLDTPVSHCDAEGVEIGDERIDSATVIWAAGVRASPAARWLDVEADRAGRVVVNADFGVPGCPGVFAIGDTALYRDAEGRPLPGLAPVAKQQGAWLGRLIASRVRGRPEVAPFRYRDAGQLAAIGRRAAVVDFGRVRLKGWLAWWFWGIVHIYFLISARSRIIVALEWLWLYLTNKRGARIIGRGP